MTDKLRTVAQAVVDESFYLSQDSHNIHELKDALTEPSPIDALIAEISHLHAEPIDDNFWIINKDELYTILDKYRE